MPPPRPPGTEREKGAGETPSFAAISSTGIAGSASNAFAAAMSFAVNDRGLPPVLPRARAARLLSEDPRTPSIPECIERQRQILVKH